MAKNRGILVTLNENDEHECVLSVIKDANGIITQGLVVGDVTFQNQEFIVIAQKGEIREDPTKGAGIEDFLDDESPENALRAVRTELAKEGMKVNKVEFNELGELTIDASY